MDVSQFPSDVQAAIALDILEAVGPVGTSKDMAIGGAYEGASQFDQMLASWMPGQNSADVDVLANKGISDARARDLSRNDGYIQSGENLYKDNIVGSMYLANAKPETKVLIKGGDEVWEEEFQQEVEAKFTLTAESPRCWLDASRSQTFTGMVRLAVGIYSMSGEVLATAEWLRNRGRPCQTAIQMVDLDRLSNPYNFVGFGAMDGRRVRGGVHLDERGAHLGYYIRKSHPSDWDRIGTIGASIDHQYIPAYKPWGRKQVIFLRDQRRAEQTRAVAQIVAGLKAIKITSKFRDLTLQQAVINAMYAASLESDLPPEAAFAAIGASAQGGNMGDSVAKYGTAYLAAVQKFMPKGFRIDNVKIPHFFPGTRLNLRQSGAPGGVGQDFEQSLLRYIAAILGVSYEELSKDFSKTNYSSARAALTQTWKFMQARKMLVADRFASDVYMLWFEEMMNAGQLETMKYSKLPNYYEGINAEAYTKVEWIGAARGQIDELKETQAAVLRIKFGLSTHEDELAKLGKDWRKTYAQLERERKDREKRGIILEESNSVNAASGSPREEDEEATGGVDARIAA